jgi:4-aminobutyrate aminotransferase-like enzyme
MSRPSDAPAHSTISATNALPKVVRGKGSYLWDATGKQYIDGSGGPAVYCLGHAHAEVNRAICDQLEALAHGYRYNFTTDALEELTEIIRARVGGNLRDRPEVAPSVHQPGTVVAWQHAGGLGPVGLCRADGGL